MLAAATGMNGSFELASSILLGSSYIHPDSQTGSDSTEILPVNLADNFGNTGMIQ